MSKVYDNVSQYIDSLEQNPNLEYLEKEMIIYALKKVSKSLTLGSIRQPVDDVKNNDIVTRGSKIGLSGNTGDSTGPHLHFGVYLNGKPKDVDNPLKYLPKI